MKHLPMDISTALNQQYGKTASRGSVARTQTIQDIAFKRLNKPKVSQAIVESRKPTNLTQLIQKIRANNLSVIEEQVLAYAAPSLLDGVRKRKFGGIAAVKALKSVKAVLLADCIKKLDSASSNDKRFLRAATTKAIFKGLMKQLKECYAGFCHEPVKQDLRMQILLRTQDIAEKMDNPLLLNCLVDAVCYECELELAAEAIEAQSQATTDAAVAKEFDTTSADELTSEEIDTAEIIEQAADENVDAGANILTIQSAPQRVKNMAGDPKSMLIAAATVGVVGFVAYKFFTK